MVASVVTRLETELERPMASLRATDRAHSDEDVRQEAMITLR